MKKLVLNQNGFIPMMLAILSLVVFVIVFVFLKVNSAN